MAITDLALSFTPIPGGAFAGGYAIFMNGGGREVADAAARNAIPDYLRSAGMTAWQQDTLIEYRLKPGPWVHTDADWDPIGGGSGGAAGPSGAIQFSDGAAGFLADDPNLHWDDLNNFLGIGTNTPGFALDVAGDFQLIAPNTGNLTAVAGNITLQSVLATASVNGVDVAILGSNTAAITGTTDASLNSGATVGINAVTIAQINAAQIIFNTPEVIPLSDNTTSLGTAAFRWSLVRAVTVTTGDLEMVSEERNAHWLIQEEHDRIVFHNKKTNKKFSIMLIPIDD